MHSEARGILRLPARLRERDELGDLRVGDPALMLTASDMRPSPTVNSVVAHPHCPITAASALASASWRAPRRGPNPPRPSPSPPDGRHRFLDAGAKLRSTVAIVRFQDLGGLGVAISTTAGRVVAILSAVAGIVGSLAQILHRLATPRDWRSARA